MKHTSGIMNNLRIDCAHIVHAHIVRAHFDRRVELCVQLVVDYGGK